MRMLAFAILALLSISPAAEVQVQGITIVEYGVYTADLQSTTRDASGVLVSTSTNFRRVVATDRVPAKIGSRFGFRYTVVGAPQGQTVEIRKVTIYPPQGLQSPTMAQPLRHFERKLSVEIGKTTYTGYKLDDPWELVPGPWTFELWYGGRKLAEQKFTVVAP